MKSNWWTLALCLFVSAKKYFSVLMEDVGDTWSPTASIRTLKYLLADETKHKAIVHQSDFIGALLQAKVKNRLFLKLDSRYTDYFP